MVCPVCNKDLTDAVHLLGNDALVLHERAHQNENLDALLMAVRTTLKRSNEVTNMYDDKLVEIRKEDYTAIKTALKTFENWKPLWSEEAK